MAVKTTQPSRPVPRCLLFSVRAFFIPVLLSAVFFLLPAACQSPPYTPGSDLPYVIFYQDSWEELKALSDRVGEVFRVFGELFRVDEEDLSLLRISVEPEAVIDDGNGGDYPALYRSNPPGIVFRTLPDNSLLLHEIAHHFVLARRGAFPAVGLNEGLATYIGWSAMGKDGVILGQIAVEHCRIAGEAAREGRLIPLDEFARMGAKEFYRPERKKLHYSQAWALVYFLLHEILPREQPFHEKCDAICELSLEELGGLDERFTAFWREFSAIDTLTAGLASKDDIQARSSAFRLGLLQDGGAAGSLLAVARDTTRKPEVREVALCAVGIIFLGSDGSRIHVNFITLLEALKHDRSERLRRTAGELQLAVERGDVPTIQTLFGRNGCGSAFYPAGGFRVSRQ
jgi:hypothetical protein